MIEAPYAPVSYGSAIAVGDTLSLDATAVASLHFRKVNVKEAFTICDAVGRFFRASLTALTETHGEALAYEAMPRSPESGVVITLACAVLQRQRMLWVAQKAAELGVTRIQPLITLKSVQADGLAHEKAHAWPGQALKGSRQCRRASVPEVRPTVTLDAFMATGVWKRADARIFLDDREEESGESVLQAWQSVVLVIGPEGGFAHVERERLEAAGARPLRLGGRVLRAETAVLAGIVVVQHRIGDMGI